MFNYLPLQNRCCRKTVSILLGVVVALAGVMSLNAAADGKMSSDLKKVNNLDELLYQLYSYLDSDCLFTMQLTDMEKVWGIKLLSREHLALEEKTEDLRNSSYFAGKPYRSEIDAFNVQVSRRENKTIAFNIYITKANDRAQVTLFPMGNYRILLPEPIKHVHTTL